ncbi:MAG: hypothetical protein H6727_17000 [Myxococcales bacterium]|nr:hypothetical protein [Myxococcales bacterium]
MPTFWTFWTKARGQKLATQIKLFQRWVVAKYPKLFESQVIGLKKGVPYDAALKKRLALYLPSLPKHIPTMKALTNTVQNKLSRFEKTFKKAFPDFAWKGTIYFTLSLGSFDGGTRRVDGKEPLLFALDGIAKYHGAHADLQPFFHHELFHVYHNKFAPYPKKGPPLYLCLWTEGLAVYVSQLLNPKASYKDLLLADLAKTVPPHMKAIKKELLSKLKLVDWETYKSFFLSRGKGPFPRRTGYYVGYLLAKRLAKRFTLDQLVRLKEAKLHEEMHRALVGL